MNVSELSKEVPPIQAKILEVRNGELVADDREPAGKAHAENAGFSKAPDRNASNFRAETKRLAGSRG